LAAISTNSFAINAAAVANGGEAFKLSNYWSSTQFNTTQAYGYNFSTVSPINNFKSIQNRFRPIRSS